MRYLTILPLLFFSFVIARAQSRPSKVNAIEFAQPPEILGSGQLVVESYLALIKDIHDHGPDLDDPVRFGHRGSNVVHAEAGAGIRVGISDNVDVVLRVRAIEWSSDGFNYVNNRREIFNLDAFGEGDLTEVSLGSTVRLATGADGFPEVAIASNVRFNLDALPWDDLSRLGATVRLLMRNRLESGSQILYSVGTVADLVWVADSRFDHVLNLQPGYSVAYLLPLGSSVLVGPELSGEYTSELGLRHWLGAGSRIAATDWLELVLAGRAGVTFDSVRYQAMLGLSVAVF